MRDTILVTLIWSRLLTNHVKRDLKHVYDCYKQRHVSTYRAILTDYSNCWSQCNALNTCCDQSQSPTFCVFYFLIDINSYANSRNFEWVHQIWKMRFKRAPLIRTLQERVLILEKLMFRKRTDQKVYKKRFRIKSRFRAQIKISKKLQLWRPQY